MVEKELKMKKKKIKWGLLMVVPYTIDFTDKQSSCLQAYSTMPVQAWSLHLHSLPSQVHLEVSKRRDTL
jgi:hypothetical protein